MTDNKLPATRPDRAIVADAEPIFDTAQFEHMARIASMMGTSSLLPAHLRVMRDENGKEITGYDREKVPCWLDEKATISNAFLIVNQARLFGGIDPFALAQSSYFVHGRLGYEGKLVQALIERRVGAMVFEYNSADKTSGAYGIKVTGWVPNANPPRQASLEGTVAEWQTKKRDGSVNDQWKTPAGATRMLHYRGTREWARMYAPGLVLGLLDDDDLEAIREDYRAKQARPVGPAIEGRRFNPLAEDGALEIEAPEQGRDVSHLAEKVEATLVHGPSETTTVEPYDPATGEISPTEPQEGGEQAGGATVAPEPAPAAGGTPDATEAGKAPVKRLPRGFPQKVDIAIMEVLRATDLADLRARWDKYADPLVVEIETGGLPTPSIDRMREAFEKRKANFETVARANLPAEPERPIDRLRAASAQQKPEPQKAAEPYGAPPGGWLAFSEHVREELAAAQTFEDVDDVLASTVDGRADLPDDVREGCYEDAQFRRKAIGDALAANDPSLRSDHPLQRIHDNAADFPGDAPIAQDAAQSLTRRSDEELADEVEGWISAMRRIRTVADLKSYNDSTITPAIKGPDGSRFDRQLLQDARETYEARKRLLSAKEGGGN
jgi:hypothetical protein